MNNALTMNLKQLRLSGLLQSLEVRLQEAAANRLSHEQFLELAVQDELTVRRDRQLQRRVAAAGFMGMKTLEDFSWDFNPGLDRSKIFQLATGQFIREARDVLFVGPPGVGKTHLAQAIGYQAIKIGHTVLYGSIFDLVRDFLRDETFAGQDNILKRYLKPDLLIVDDKDAVTGSRTKPLAESRLVRGASPNDPDPTTHPARPRGGPVPQTPWDLPHSGNPAGGSRSSSALLCSEGASGKPAERATAAPRALDRPEKKRQRTDQPPPAGLD